jgi:hypothetical protein
MGTALDISASAVGTALALSSVGVSIKRIDPLDIDPDDAFQHKFSDFKTVLEVFRQHLAENLSGVLTSDVQQLALDQNTKIQDVVEAIEALILAK